MKISNILFTAMMMDACLDWRKTHTRRLVTGQALSFLENDGFTPGYVGSPEMRFSRWGYAGDVIWARESCRAEELPDGQDGVRYLADDKFIPIENTPAAAERWVAMNHYDIKRRNRKGTTVPGIHMPRWASRLTMVLKEVRIERLHDITEEDALAEGIIYIEPTEEDDAEYQYRRGGDIFGSAVEAYKYLWAKINGWPSWEANPWVWVLAFEPHPMNVDAYLRSVGIEVE